MKSKFTFSFFKRLFLPIVLATLSLNLAGQTSHKVSVKSAFNTAGTYNYQCDPHVAMGMVGKVIVNPKPASETFTLTVNFMDMLPHDKELFWLSVIDQATKKEIYRVKTKVTPAFSLVIPGIEIGKSYWVDFFGDHNNNGVYNPIPADHAWRLSLNNVTGNSVLNFSHETNFFEINWKTKLTVRFTGMTPHIGQKLTLFLKNSTTDVYLDTIVVNQVTGAAFDVSSWKIKPGSSYKIDFYSDHNKNGIYNAPPTDHAWRILLNKVVSDTIISFAHNTNFTNIFNATSSDHPVSRKVNIQLLPNPASQYIELMIPPDYAAISSLKIYSITGTLIDQRVINKNLESFRWDTSQFKNGLYFMEINTGHQKEILKFYKQ